MFRTSKAQDVNTRAAVKALSRGDRRNGSGKEHSILLAQGNGSRSEVQYQEGVVYEFDPARVKPLPQQPREMLDPEWVTQLSLAIKEEGQKQPGTVVPLRGDKNYDVMVFVGHNRAAACLEAGCSFRALVDLSGGDLWWKAATENCHRLEYTLSEWASIVKYGRDKKELTWDQLSISLGKSHMTLQGYYDINKLVPEALALCGRKVEPRHRLRLTLARKIAKFPPKIQHELLGLIKSCSGREAEVIVENMMHKKKDVVRQSSRGRVLRPADDFENLLTRIKGASDQFRSILSVDPERMKSATNYRTVEQNASLVAPVAGMRVVCQELLRFFAKTMPLAHVQKISDLAPLVPLAKAEANKTKGTKKGEM